jgi:alcohol dehydrogenase class IV
MWEKSIPIDEITQIRGETTVILGIGAIERTSRAIKEIRKKDDFDKVIIVTGKSSYKKTGAWDHVVKALNKYNIKYVLYNKVSSNPTTEEVDEAVKMAREINANGVIAIGGGSAIDAAKSTAIMTLYPEYNTTELFECYFEPTEALPILAINTTHGTGSETNRFAVLNVPSKDFKIGIDYDFIYPKIAIEDPKLMISLSENQTKYTAIDAVNHALEACTSIFASPYSIMIAKEVVRLVAKYLPEALEDGENLEARYCLTYASVIAGKSFDSSSLHITHALEHPLSAVNKDISHGLGLTLLLPSVIKNIYKEKAEILADVLSPIVPDLKGTKREANKAAKGVKKWLTSLGVTDTLSTLGFNEDDIEGLVQLVYKTPGISVMLFCSPVPVTQELVEGVYREALAL